MIVGPACLPIVHDGEGVEPRVAVLNLEVEPACVPKSIDVIMKKQAVSAVCISGQGQIA